MHIPDGILPLPVTLGGYAASMALAWFCIRKIKQREDPRRDVPKAALLTAAFFVASLIHIPIPSASIHLALNGLLGVLLGWFAFPAILIGLFFQAVMFGHGGLTTLGVNGVILGLPALAAFALFRMRDWSGAPTPRKNMAFAFLAGASAICLSVALFSVILFTNMPAHMSAVAEQRAVLTLMAAHVPLMVLEGLISAMLVAFFLRIRPDILEGI